MWEKTFNVCPALRMDERSPMKTTWILFGLVVTSALALAQSPASSAAECPKNVSFAVVAGGQPVAAVPAFVARAIGSDKHQRYPGLCFAQSPNPRAKNYVVVFSTQQDSFVGLVPTVLKYVNSAPIPEDSALNTVYGEMWHYTSNQPAEASTTTLNLLHTDTSTVLFVRAYNEQGMAISQVSLKEVGGWLHTREKLLDRVLGDIRTDSRQVAASPLPLKTSLPVYYVNCDVPVKSLAGQEPDSASVTSAPAPAAAPHVPVATLEFWSSPAGADVYLDGRLVSRTPSSVTVPPGEYTITMRKQNFGMWQRKLQVTEGKRKISGYLEQKVITLGSALH